MTCLDGVWRGLRGAAGAGLLVLLAACGGGGGGGGGGGLPVLPPVTGQPSDPPQNPPPAAGVGRVVAHGLQSMQVGSEYALEVYLPPSYGTGSTRYPTIYVLDGDAKFTGTETRFQTFRQSLERLRAEAILIGIGGTARRQTDYNFPGANAYHRFLTLELVPFIESTYRADPKMRMLTGLSTSGNLAASALFLEGPDKLVFSYFLSFEAAFWQQRDELYALEKAMFDAMGDKSLPVTLILAHGYDNSGSNAPYVNAMYERIAASRYKGLTLIKSGFQQSHVGTDQPAFEDSIRRILGVP